MRRIILLSFLITFSLFTSSGSTLSNTKSIGLSFVGSIDSITSFFHSLLTIPSKFPHLPPSKPGLLYAFAASTVITGGIFSTSPSIFSSVICLFITQPFLSILSPFTYQYRHLCMNYFVQCNRLKIYVYQMLLQVVLCISLITAGISFPSILSFTTTFSPFLAIILLSSFSSTLSSLPAVPSHKVLRNTVLFLKLS